MKNKWKKLLLSGMALSAIFLTACGKGDKKDSSGKVKLDIMYYHGALGKTTIENAKKKFSDYELKFQQVPADTNYDMQLKTNLNSDSAPDIAAINSNIQDFKGYYDKFANLLDYGTGDLADKQVEWKWDSTLVKTDDGDYQMALPLDIGPTANFYNVKNFKAAGLPTDPDEVSEKISTIEDLMAAAKQMKEKADVPMFQSASDFLAELYQQMTKKIYNEEGELTFADGELREMWDYAVEAIQNGYSLGTLGGSVDSATAKARGLFGSHIQASWGIADLAESGAEPGDWQVAKRPGNPSNSGGSYLSVLKSTKHPKEATEVIMFLTGEDSQRINYKEQGLFPTFISLQEEDEFKNATHEIFGDQKFNKYFIESAQKLKYIELDPRESGAFRYFEDEINLVETQDKDPEKAWDDAVEQVKVHSEG